MSERHESDRWFHENLMSVGRRARERVGEPVGSQTQWAGLSDGVPGHGGVAARRSFRGPALLSTVGLAAALVLAATLFHAPTGGRSVHAATVLAHLAAQVQGDEVLELAFDSVSVEEMTLQGRLQVSDKAVAGDVHVTVSDVSRPLPFEVDASLAVSEDGGWLLLRQLQIPEPEVQQVVAAFLPPGSQWLLTFPPETAREKLKLDGGAGLAEVRNAAGGELAKFAQEILGSQSEVGAEVAPQSDGTVLVTVPIRNAESVRTLLDLAAKAAGKDGDSESTSDVSDLNELLGGSFRVVYDPQAEVVRSFAVSDVGPMRGTVTVSLRSGVVDPRLLDVARVMTPSTRTLDLGAAASMFEALGLGGEKQTP